MCSAGALDVLVYTVAVCKVYVCVQPVLFDVLVYTVAVCNVYVCVQPVLFDVLVYMAAGLGLLIHYIVPQLRTEMPWLCCAHPVLPSSERGKFEVRGKISSTTSCDLLITYCYCSGQPCEAARWRSKLQN